MAEMAWVRQLARALVKNEALADDIAQDTWLVAAEQQPDTDRPLRPWLARVVRNLIMSRRRGEARRDKRAIAYESQRAVPTPADLIERVELQRALADELLALAEPYRSTVLLHFVEGYSSAEIARRLGIPDATVRRRLKTALDQLREALRKRSDQPKRGWLAALVPLARVPVRAPLPGALGMVAMKKLAVALLVLLLLILGGVLWHGRGRGHVAATDLPNTPGVSGQSTAVTPVMTTQIPAWLSDPGASPRRIAGRVVFRGIPVGGAKVQLGLVVHNESTSGYVMPDSVSTMLQPIAAVTSKADGTFDFGVQPAAMFTVSAVAQNFAAVAVTVANYDPRAAADHLVLALGDCGSRLSGTISDASGGSIAKARISAAGLTGAESDAAGTYSVCLTPRHGYGTPMSQVRVEADGYGTVKQDVIVVGDIQLDFKLVPEAVLVGRVTTSDGLPVEGARVIAMAPPGSATIRIASGWATSDRDGAFRIAGLAPGAFDLYARAQGLGTEASIPVVATPGATSREIIVVLAPPAEGQLAQVRGHVLMDGAPVAGAVVAAVHDGKRFGGSTSQADGSFVLDAVPYGTTRFEVTPYRADQSQEIKVDRPVIDGVRIDVSRMATIRGRVTRHGTPVAGADVMYEVTPQITLHAPPPVARTDANGEFVMEAVPPGPGRLAATDYPSKACSDWVPFTVGPSDDKIIDLDLAFAGEVKGAVVDEAGAVVPGVYVRMDAPGDMCEAMTDAKGQFDCTLLAGGVYQPTVAPLPGGRQGFAPATGDQFEPIRVPRDGVVNVTIAVKHERVAIRGKVVDDAGVAIPDVYVEAIGRGELPAMDPPSTMTNVDGRFEIRDLARGGYNVRARAANGTQSELRDVAAPGDSVTIKFASTGAIEGTLVGFSKTPDVFAIQDLPNGMVTRTRVDGSRFSKAGLAPGRYTIHAQAGVDVDTAAVEIRAGEIAKVTLRDRGAGKIEGTVSDFGTRAPLAGMRCDAIAVTNGQPIMIPPDPAQQVFTDAAGRYSVSAPLGRARIVCSAQNGEARSPAGGEVEVTRSGPAKLDAISVRASFGDAAADAGFMISPVQLPITVADVLPTGPAAAAGLRAGDQVVTIDDASLQGLLPLGAMFLVANHRPGTVVTLGISRGGATQTIKIPVVARPH